MKKVHLPLQKLFNLSLNKSIKIKFTSWKLKSFFPDIVYSYYCKKGALLFGKKYSFRTFDNYWKITRIK